MSIKQRQSILDGKLTLMNSVNDTDQTAAYSNNRATTNDRIGRLDSNLIEYNIFTLPEFPNIRILQLLPGATTWVEVSVITLSRTPSITKVEIISPYQITLFKGSYVITVENSVANILIATIGSYLGQRSTDNYVIKMDPPVFSSDGYYHYMLDITPTEVNNSMNSRKLGDLSIVSRIHDNSWRSSEWVGVNDSSQSMSLLRTLLRNDNPRIIELDTLPNIKNAIPGIVYKLGSKYYVLPESGLIKETNDPTSFYYIDSSSRYYYSQREIDNTFGVSERKISVIQSGNYYYKLVKLGDTSNLLRLGGDSREYEVQRVNTITTPQTITGYNNYYLSNILNCNVTKGSSGKLTLIAPSRISNYSPYDLISDSDFYTSLYNNLPVSFDVVINEVETGNINTVGKYLQLLSGSSVGSSIIKLSSEPIQGTSGLSKEFSDYYYKDNITGLYKYIPILETYIDNSEEITGISRIIAGYDFYTTKISTSWVSESLTYSEKLFSTLLAEKTSKYGAEARLVGFDSQTSFMDMIINFPINTDDYLLEAEVWNDYVQRPGDSIEEIEVDNFPTIVSLSIGNKIVKYKRRGDSSSPSGIERVYRPRVTNNSVIRMSPNCNWYNIDGIRSLYHYMRIANDVNGYSWISTTPSVNDNDNESILMSYPNDWSNPTRPGEDADYYNYGSIYCIWERQSNPPAEAFINTDALPSTRGEALDNWYEYRENTEDPYYYYKATNNYYLCSVNSSHYSIVAINRPPDEYNQNVTYSLNDTIVFNNLIFHSLQDNNIGNQPPGSAQSNDYWLYISDIIEFSSSSNPIKYKYYKVGINKFPADSTYNRGTSLPDPNNPLNPEYFGVLYNTGDRVETYYRKGFDFQLYPQGGEAAVGDHGLWITTSSLEKRICENRIFKVVISGIEYYYQLKNFAIEPALPNNFSINSQVRDDDIRNSNLPGNIILKGDTEGCGFGLNNYTTLGTKILYDFNQYKVRYSTFSESVEYTQRSTPRGLVSNFGRESDDYRLYLGDSNKNMIEVHLEAGDTSFSGFIGSYNLHSPITSSSGTGEKPQYIKNSGYGNETEQLTDPILDGNNTPNFTVTFPENTGDQDLIREYYFNISDGNFVSYVYLRIIQETNPGQVIPSPTSSRSLYFLSNGIPYTTFEFSSNIEGLNLQNIQIINDYGEDILDRDEAFVQELNQSTTFTNYSAFLKLKPNTRHEVFSGFRIKIGRISGDVVTDRTLNETTAKFYKLINSTWTLLDNTFKPTYKEPYFETLPEDTTQFNSGDVICVCSSLRGYQGYYSTYLYDLDYTSGRSLYYDLEWRSKDTLEEVISDLVTLVSFTPDTNFLDTLERSVIITDNLPDISSIKEVGIIYKIGNTFYYTFADRITSNYTYGTVNLPNYINSSGSANQKYHLEILQKEYDSYGNLSDELDVRDLLSSGQYYTISDPDFMTTWTLLDSSIPPNEIEDISSNETCSGDIIFSDTSSSSITPYFMNTYTFYTGSPILIKTELRLKLKYNNISGISMDEEYKWVKYLFTLYIKWSNF